MIISRTPFRISFFGGGTDYPVWYRENGGAVLATSIDKYCYISCRYLPPFFEHKSRIVYSKIENIINTNSIEHPSVRETLKYLNVQEGLEIHHDGDLPARTGLGSSSSFTVGLLHSLKALKQSMPSKLELAREAIHVERNILRENVGSQDQVSAAVGGFNRIGFTRDEDIQITPIIMNRQKFTNFQDHMMLFFTGFSRFASQIAEKQIENTPKKVKELQAMQAMVDQAIDILTSNQDLREFGKLLHESWKLKRSLTDKISTPEIDAIYAAALEAGALGGKLLGAGGGGFMLLFAEPEKQAEIRQKLRKFLYVPFRFEHNGSQIIFYEPSASERDVYPNCEHNGVHSHKERKIFSEDEA